MKNIFEISFITYIFAIILIISGYINYLLVYIIIMSMHELGHIIMIKILGYKINKIKIFPGGGIILTNIAINIKSRHLFLISIAGIIMQILLFFIVKGYSYNYFIFKRLNIFLIIYNLMPIYPMDGYKILLSITENIFKYKIALYISYIISFLFLFIMFILLKNVYIFVMLYIFNVKNIQSLKYYYNKFLLERHIYIRKYKKIKHVKNINSIYKNKHNYIKNGDYYIDEFNYFRQILFRTY